MNHRNYLKNSVLLCGVSDNKRYTRKFFIKDMISSKGASAVCYSAYYDKSGIGVLKEFYPMELNSLTREKDGQLVQVTDDINEKQRFEKLLSEYLEPYNMLIEARRDEELATFIPPFEIFYGCSENGDITGTVYIWSPEPTLETFDKLCDSIHEHPSQKPEYNLVKVLYSIESLAKCVCALHKSGLIHRDIKPSNFGFQKRGDELLTQSISLFDIDTICSVYNVSADYARGTDGFREQNDRKANNQTDIYAIGATLFYAVIVNDEAKENNYLYRKSFFSRIKDFVDTSELITASESNSHPFVRSLLTKILRKCLCVRDERYKSCEELISDIQKALYYVVPAEISNRGKSGEKWILADVEKLKQLNNGKEKNSVLAIQYHLYVHPLYKYVSSKKERINVIIVGFGKYGQEFLDVALQTAQVPGIHLNIIVISENVKEDKYVYLEERPELVKFFNIDGSLSEEQENYGDISFINHSFSDKTDENRIWFSNLFSASAEKPDYAFIATGSDSQNYITAGVVGDICQTSLIVEGRKNNSEFSSESLLPVYVNENVRSYPLFAEIERMAFNVHLIWNKNLNINFSDVKKEFRKPYNYNSCVSFAVSIKYKLHGIGIDTENNDLSAVSQKYIDFINTHKPEKNLLIYYEHRRWVTEKLCTGYRCIKNPDECANGKTKDEKNKRHICLLRSSPENTLVSAGLVTENGEIDRKKWDSADESVLCQLDALDRMSVELHLVHLKNAETEKKSSLLNGNIAAAIVSHIEKDSDCIVSFQELLTCMNDIWNEDSKQWNRYEGLRRGFVYNVRHSEELSERDINAVLSLADSLNEKFYPILASQQYRDYKKDDIVLIEGIPFIITYSDSVYMVIPYAVGSNTDLFNNLASPTVVNPSRLLYIAYCSSIQELDEIRNSIPYIVNFMNKKKLRAKAEFIIGFKNGARIGSVEQIESDFKSLSGGRVAKVKMIPSSDCKEYVNLLKEYLLLRKKKKPYFFLEKNNTNLSELMDSENMFDEFSAYSYNSAEMKYTVINNCDMISYIRMKPFITVTDMSAFKMSADTAGSKPEFYHDYKELWDKYCSSVSTWKHLCSMFRKNNAENDTIAYFSRNGRHADNADEYSYIVPFNCKSNISKITDALINEKLIGAKSCISCLTTQSCLVFIEDFYNLKATFDNLFSRMNIYLQTDYIRCETDSKLHAVKVVYDSLVVDSLNCEQSGDEEYQLLDYLYSKGYLLNLKYDRKSGKAGFSFATHQIKDLLSSEDRILEVYTYHKAKETGEFDDIRSGFEIDWKNSPVSEEFDCILTKGFSALFVECTADRDIKSDYYTKASGIAETFGINATVVLLADTQTSEDSTAANEKTAKPGEKQRVITISDREDINNIGVKLLSLLK